MGLFAGHRMKWTVLAIALLVGFGATLRLGYGAGAPELTVAFAAATAGGSASAQEAAGKQQEAAGPHVPTAPRGKKLMLQDGSFHLVREYKVEGDRVRYYSVERSQWEEIPADLVDWDATKKVEAAEEKQDAALLAKVHGDEKARKAVVVDIDASVEVAPNVYLPDGEGLFLLDNLKVTPLLQADTDIALNKTQLLKQILIPIPIIPSRHTVSLLGTRAKLRFTNGQPEFYRRTKDRHEPEIYLIHAKVHGDKRQIENLDRLFQVEFARRNSLPMEKWELVKGVYRLTMSQPLEPGEYALAEVARANGTELYVWDFGVDGKAGAAKKK